MKVILTAILLSTLPYTAHAKALFEAKTQDEAGLEVVLKENMFGKRTLVFRNEKNKVLSVDQNVNIAQVDPSAPEKELVLITGNSEEVDAGLARKFWGQSGNENGVRLQLVWLALSGKCDTAQGVFKGIIFEFSQPDTVGKVACLK